MKIENYIQSGFLLLLWAVSFMIPFAGYFVAPSNAFVDEEDDYSVSWLSLPKDLVASIDPLSGWNSLCRKKSHVGLMSIGTPQTPDLSVSENKLLDVPGLERIRLFGVISEANAPVFCFFDPINKEWFKMSAGDRNDQVGIKLVAGDGKNFPCLVDLENGSRFQIRDRDWMLSPLVENSNSSMEELE